MGILSPYDTLGKPDQPEDLEMASLKELAEKAGTLRKLDPINPPLRLNNRDLQQAINDTYTLWQKTDTQSDTFYRHLNTLLGIQLIRARAGQGD